MGPFLDVYCFYERVTLILIRATYRNTFQCALQFQLSHELDLVFRIQFINPWIWNIPSEQETLLKYPRNMKYK